MEKEKDTGWEIKRTFISRRSFCKTMAGISIVCASGTYDLFASEQNAPAEPENLDVPTPWQEGDPAPVEMEVPSVEPEQTSTEAPPCQPMDDDAPEQPSEDHVWVSGYWWWRNRSYVWVPGYWALPPNKGLVYIAGHWAYNGNQWIFVRGGWAQPDTTKIIVAPGPRPVLKALVITAPRRIVRRHIRWGYFPDRRIRRRVTRRVTRRNERRVERRKK